MIILSLIYLFILGAAIGSFLNVLIDRLPEKRMITGRSECDYCHRKLNWWELIPIVSFVMQDGKSRCCKKKLSLQYPFIEAVTGLLFVLIVNDFGRQQMYDLWQSELISLLGIASCLIVIFMVDFKKQLIPDSIQFTLLFFSLVYNALRIFPSYHLLITNYLAAALVVMSPILFLWIITRGRGMGFGDVKLAFVMGFLLGIKSGLIALYLAFISGALVGMFLLIFRKKGIKSKIAFGPFMVIGIMAMLFWQKEVYGLVRALYGF